MIKVSEYLRDNIQTENRAKFIEQMEKWDGNDWRSVSGAFYTKDVLDMIKSWIES